MAFKSKLVLIKGSDKSSLIRLVDKNTKNPIDLSGINSIQVIFKNADRTDFIMRNMTIPANKARLVRGTAIFEASVSGAVGNSIILIFDGVKTNAQVMADWNTTNPDNQVTFSGTAGEILPSGIFNLGGGHNSYVQIEKWGNPAFGQILLRMTEKDTLALKTGPNQGIKIVLDGALTAVRIVGYFDNTLEVVGYV